MNNLKPLMPSMKAKTRYVVFEIISEKEIDLDAFETTLLDVCMDFMGRMAFSEADIRIFKKLYINKKVILKVNRKYTSHIMVCLGLIKKVKNIKTIIKSIKVCGSIKKAKYILEV
ncbi:MAG: Rpp14/Pop5 family protein [Candidatus Nanoarchaeia archaeon]|nr:Rpp14/Pop5 family protein [Candidatus Nanoarchaeia archaeon]